MCLHVVWTKRIYRRHTLQSDFNLFISVHSVGGDVYECTTVLILPRRA